MTDHPYPLADALIATTNAGDADAVLALFTPDAVVDDPSTGHRFDGHAAFAISLSAISSTARSSMVFSWVDHGRIRSRGHGPDS